MIDDGCGLVDLDLGRCLTGTLLGWVPDWVWWGLAHWQWFAYGLLALAVLTALARIYSAFGIWGLIGVMNGAAFFAGFLLGRKPTVRVVQSPGAPPAVHFPGTSRPIPIRRPAAVRHHETIFDTLNKLGQR